MAKAKTAKQYIQLGKFKYGWNSENYGSIARDLGVKVAKPKETDIVYGANNPKPPVIRISFFVRGNNGATRSTTRFCDPKQLGKVILGALNGKKIKVGSKSYTIAGVSQAR